MSCSRVLNGASPDSGGQAVFDWESMLVTPGLPAATSKMQGQVLQSCELITFADWRPVFDISIGLLVAVWAIRHIIDFWQGADSD